MRKMLFAVLTVLLIFISAEANAQEEDNAGEILERQYESYDFNDADALFDKYCAGTSFSSVVRDILSGSFDPQDSFAANIAAIAVPKLNEQITAFTIMFGMALLLSAAGCIQSDTASRYRELLGTVSNAAFAIWLFSGFFSASKQAAFAVGELTRVTDTVVPLLTVALTASGGVATASILNPESAVISQIVNNIISGAAIPAVIILSVFVILDSVFAKDKFAGVFAFGKSAITWCIGAVFTFYASVVSIKGLAAASYDGISLRTVRYAISNSVPLVGSLAGDGINLALACCSMVKSAIGIASVILIVLSVLSPLVSMILYMLMLRCFAACVSPFAPPEMIKMTSSAAELMKLLISAVAGAAVMLLIVTGIVIGAANAI